jgi:radical SAM protein with 4Fe4S-binding SPASM domain
MDVSHPRWVFIQLLEHCNLRCRMCYEWGDHGAYHDKKALHRLDINVVEKVIEDCTPGRPLYDLYGGEPLLYRDIWAVLQAIRRAGSRAQMPTNGTLLAKSAERLVEAGLHRIWVSLDGPPEINDRQRGPGVFTRAVEGIDRLQAVRRRRGVRYPLIGINTVVTPLNYRHLKTFFFEALDLTKVDCISLELQAYLTAQNHRQYEELLQREFGVSEARVAKGFVNDPAIFTDIDVRLLADQVAQITEACERRGLMLSTYPTVMSEENIRKYFDARWHSMSSVRTRCAFPWISTEINARGDVTSCHAFYDLTLGNVYESSIIDIWRGDRYAHYRRHLRKNLLPICQSCVLFYEDQGALQGSGTPCNPRAN